MNLLWPGFLLLLGLIPILIGAYVWVLRRRRRYTVRYSSLSLVRDALPWYSRFRRFLPLALFLFALGSLSVAVARPVSIVSVPTNQTTIILAMDVSGSMCQTDIQPSRLEAAEAAAISFIQGQKYGTQIGIVAFSSFAELVQPPTSDANLLQDAIRSLLTGRGTAIGSGILESIDAIAEIDPNVAPSVTDPSAPQPPPVVKGAYAPSIIVLLTDGANNAGALPLDAAQQAADRGVRVYTIGFGTEIGSQGPPNCGVRFMGREPFGGGPPFGGGGNGRFRRGIDEDTLKLIAGMTDGTYYSAESGNELQSVFQELPTNIIVRHEVMEVSVYFAGIGALAAAIAIILSMLWHPLP